MMQKVVLKVELHDDRIKQKAMKTVSGLSGVESVSVDMKNKNLTLIGNVDPVYVVRKLRKWCETEIVSIGPAKEEKKKEESKSEGKKDSIKVAEPVKLHEACPPFYYYQMRPSQYTQYHHYVQSEEDPAGCVIC